MQIYLVFGYITYYLHCVISTCVWWRSVSTMWKPGCFDSSFPYSAYGVHRRGGNRCTRHIQAIWKQIKRCGASNSIRNRYVFLNDVFLVFPCFFFVAYGDEANLDDVDVHSVTSNMKLYFRRLAQPLIPSNMYRAFIEAASEFGFLALVKLHVKFTY